MLESEFKKQAKESIKKNLNFLGVDIDFIDTKPNNRSMPDLIILGPRYWAALEFKKSKDSPYQPNQDYHVMRLNNKGYATFVYPENLLEVIGELEDLFAS